MIHTTAEIAALQAERQREMQAIDADRLTKAELERGVECSADLLGASLSLSETLLVAVQARSDRQRQLQHQLAEGEQSNAKQRAAAEQDAAAAVRAKEETAQRIVELEQLLAARVSESERLLLAQTEAAVF